MIQVNIHIAKAQLSELIQKALLGEEIIIARDNKPIAKIIPFQAKKSKRCLGLAKGLITMAPDFNDPLDDFKEYTE